MIFYYYYYPPVLAHAKKVRSVAKMARATDPSLATSSLQNDRRTHRRCRCLCRLSKTNVVEHWILLENCMLFELSVSLCVCLFRPTPTEVLLVE